MTLIELQKVLGDRVNVTLDDSLTSEERQIENERTSLIIGLAKQQINNGDLIIRTEKLLAQTRALKHSYAMELIDGTGKNPLG